MNPHFSRLTSLVLVIVFLFSAGCTPVGDPPARSTAPYNDNPVRLGLAQNYGQMPLLFVPNQGQIDEQVAYYVQGRGATIFFTTEGLTFDLTAASLSPTQEGAGAPEQAGRWVLKLDFLSANPRVLPQGLEQAETLISYFQGSPEQWHTGLPTFRRLVYPDLWTGIDLVYSGEADRLKYEFVVHPGADPGQIRLAYRGASALTLDPDGQLVVETPLGSLQDETPFAYQVSGGKQAPVAAAYALAAAKSGRVAYGFQVGEYDPALPLIIDPAVLIYCGYIGGADVEYSRSIAVDSSGAAYIVGDTYSDQTTFPVTIGPGQTYNGSGDIFVAKVRADGSGLVYAGYIGGSEGDEAHGIAVDGDGAAYIIGKTYSADFPVKGGPYLSYKTEGDAFVAKVLPDGSGLAFAGYIGSNGDDFGRAIAVDASGAAYVTGSTGAEEESDFPEIVGPDLEHNGGTDAFVAKVLPDGSGLAYSGYIGGSGEDDVGRGIAVDASGAAYVSGTTDSDHTTFPILGGPDLTFNGGTKDLDAFVAKVNPAGSALVYAGYIGGLKMDYGIGIAVDGSGSAYVTGYTGSDQTSFPVSGGPDLTHNGDYDAFVARVRPDGSELIYAGYIGGSEEDVGHDIAIDGSRAAYITGYTKSDQATFPVISGPDLTFNGWYDAYIAKVLPDGSGLAYAGYIGGNGADDPYSVAVDENGSAYVTGHTSSGPASFPLRGGPDLSYAGMGDAFVAKVELLTTRPGSFSKTGPSDGTVEVSTFPTLRWDISAGATNYEYCCDTSGDGVCDSAWIDTLVSTSVSLTNLSYNTTYYWQVRARNIIGETYADGGAWWSFIIEKSLYLPVILN